MNIIDLDTSSVRELNARLHGEGNGDAPDEWRVLNPHGKHSLAVGWTRRTKSPSKAIPDIIAAA